MSFLKNLFKRQSKPGLFDPSGHERLMNEDLHQVIEALSLDDSAANRRRLHEILLESTFCLPSEDTGQGTSRISAVQDEAGEVALVAFSDPAALRRWQPNPASMLVMPARELFQMAVENNFAEILLNPAGPAGGTLARPEFTSLAQGTIPG